MKNENGGNFVLKVLAGLFGVILAIVVSVIITFLQVLNNKIERQDAELSKLLGQVARIEGVQDSVIKRNNRISIRQLKVFEQLVDIYVRMGYRPQAEHDKQVVRDIEKNEIQN